ncbi:hypothetical protein [Rhodoflexus caldus]|uniref:hypothetical protein n=1 Tax=Rhodoflexus caldus TaxID=2891236 RepID=UPI00202A4370|nr:hypothetical protein [Rhodoflexus caldus]
MSSGEFSLERLITTIAVMLFTLTIIFLFLVNKSQWIEEKKVMEFRYDSLKMALGGKSWKMQEALRYDSLQKQYFRNNRYDPLVSNGFRMYGLFKDFDNTYTISEVAEKFNISNPKSIKVSEADGENWYIVPVKGVHLVRPKETAASIARLYYRNSADSVLIKQFNQKISSGQMIFIPFEK